MSILEPFIDTMVICTITGLVILSSGVWTEKFENRFEESSICFLSEELSDQNQQDVNKLRDYVYSCSGELSLNTDLTIKSGSMVSSDLTYA